MSLTLYLLPLTNSCLSSEVIRVVEWKLSEIRKGRSTKSKVANHTSRLQHDERLAPSWLSTPAETQRSKRLHRWHHARSFVARKTGFLSCCHLRPAHTLHPLAHTHSTHTSCFDTTSHHRSRLSALAPSIEFAILCDNSFPSPLHPMLSKTPPPLDVFVE